MSTEFELSCRHCSWTQLCGTGAMIPWLQRSGVLRRESDSDLEVLTELFRTSAGKFTCPECGKVGLAAQEVDEENDEDWGFARACEVCKRPIPRERLEIFPDTRLCVACQSGEERGAPSADVEYCPKCGSVMALKQVRGGVTRYSMQCPVCRSR